jgi:PAS domain-containing protein
VDQVAQRNANPLVPAVIALGQDRVITHWSHGAESLFGVRREDAIGVRADRLDGWHLDPVTLLSYTEIPAGRSRTYVNQVVSRGGVHLTMNSVASASADGRGRREILIRFSLSPGSKPGTPADGWRPATDAGHQHLPRARRIISRIRSRA